MGCRDGGTVLGLWTGWETWTQLGGRQTKRERRTDPADPRASPALQLRRQVLFGEREGPGAPPERAEAGRQRRRLVGRRNGRTGEEEPDEDDASGPMYRAGRGGATHHAKTRTNQLISLHVKT